MFHSQLTHSPSISQLCPLSVDLLRTGKGYFVPLNILLSANTEDEVNIKPEPTWPSEDDAHRKPYVANITIQETVT